MDKKVIALGCDHAGYDYKEFIKEFLQSAGYTVKDFGTHSKDSVDYPDFVHPVAEAIESGSAQAGLLFCGSANGVAITANKHRDIRAAIAWRDDVSMLARQHNDANVLCIPARFVSAEDAKTFVQTFLDTPFEGGRHATRVQKICAPSA
jgi:ribose 5-phosphate isomerase B